MNEAEKRETAIQKGNIARNEITTIKKHIFAVSHFAGHLELNEVVRCACRCIISHTIYGGFYETKSVFFLSLFLATRAHQYRGASIGPLTGAPAHAHTTFTAYVTVLTCCWVGDALSPTALLTAVRVQRSNLSGPMVGCAAWIGRFWVFGRASESRPSLSGMTARVQRASHTFRLCDPFDAYRGGYHSAHLPNDAITV